ncbi:MAG: nicotinate-nicotinamide nucleotide adenylyltransferase [Kiritimatiellae bacterium]|nr:nicotinate-nicotinamide nucleotide adenylyltransferase [Kiritimatiellia bacterium]
MNDTCDKSNGSDTGNARRIGIFGGSFSPIHLGHVGVAERASAEHGLSKVLVVPAHVSPFKTEGPAPLDDELRWRLVNLACEGHPLLEPCDIELRRGGVSYAIDTVREIKARNPDAELFFIVGEDSVAGLPHWRNYDELSRLCRFVSFPRTRESSTEIRRRMEAGEPLEGLVDPRVAAELAVRRGAGSGGRGSRLPRP